MLVALTSAAESKLPVTATCNRLIKSYSFSVCPVASPTCYSKSSKYHIFLSISLSGTY